MEPRDTYDHDEAKAMAGTARPSAVEEAADRLAKATSSLHDRLDRLSAVLAPYLQPDREPEDGDTRDRDPLMRESDEATSSHRQHLETLTERVHRACLRIDALLSRSEL